MCCKIFVEDQSQVRDSVILLPLSLEIANDIRQFFSNSANVAKTIQN